MNLARRDFIKTVSAATLSALGANFPRLLAAEETEKIAPRADTLIILWIAGG
ncbi:twin-arginine translocation signal domain-containing protein, partial [Candidatus Sumerlaeota bacterium]|nr:twin-arginine translocation signal domain-containing protein [Candidatus Sumerlaeota bacterium]